MKWMSRLLMVLGRILLTLVAAAIVLYALLVAINWKDRPASPATAALLRAQAERPRVRDTDNGYIFVLGITAPREADPFAAGTRRRDWLVAQLAAPVFDPDSDPLRDDSRLLAGRSATATLLSRDCNTAGTECLLALRSHPEGLATWIREEGWLLDRYKQLIGLGQWQEVMPFDVLAPLPSYHVAFEGQKLLLAEAHELGRAGRTDEARALADADARFWLMVLANADTLISKMIALRGAERNMLWTGMTSRQLPAPAMASVVPEIWRVPLDRRTCSLRRVMAGEWRFDDRYLRQMDSGADDLEKLGEPRLAIWKARLSWALQAPLWQAQDASNRIAASYLEIGGLLDTDCADMAPAIARARTAQGRAEAAVPWYHPYNLPFNMLTHAGTGDYGDYGARLADMEAMRRALLVTVEMRGRQVPPAMLPQTLAASPLRNPFNDEPFLWEPGSGTLTFRGLSEDKQGWHHYPY